MLRQELLYLSLAIVSVAYFVAYFIARTITHRVSYLSSLMKAVQNGNLEAIVRRLLCVSREEMKSGN
jgi:HAMP domain-containing protein